jgi:hypothetical protein
MFKAPLPKIYEVPIQNWENRTLFCLKVPNSWKREEKIGRKTINLFSTEQANCFYGVRR